MKTVRIRRKRKSFGMQCIGVSDALLTITRILLGGYVDQGKQRMEAARLEALQVQVTVNRQRAAKESNNVVKGDIQIELQQIQLETARLNLEIARKKAKAYGVGVSDFEADRY